jgi:hypothetical protein
MQGGQTLDLAARPTSSSGMDRHRIINPNDAIVPNPYEIEIRPQHGGVERHAKDAQKRGLRPPTRPPCGGAEGLRFSPGPAR